MACMHNRHEAPAPRPLATPGRAIPHILSTSSTMLGVCMTVLSLNKLGDDPLPYWFIDKLVALAALMFLASSLCSFISLRSEDESMGLERRAEVIFIGGLALLAGAAVILAFIVS